MVVQRLKTIAHVIAGQSPSSDDVKPLEEGIPFIQGNAEFGSLHPIPKWECSTATKFAEPGDILVSVRAPVGEVNIADTKIGIGRGLAAIRPKDASLSKWLYFALLSNKEYLNSIATGSTFTAVTASEIGNIRLTIPEHPEAIADEVDRELAEIDDFIADQQRLKLLLKEKLDTSIEHEMWNQNFDLVPLKYISSILPGFAFKSSDFVEDDNQIPLLRGVNVGVSSLRWNDTVYLNKSKAPSYHQFRLQKDDLVLGLDRPVISNGVRIAKISETETGSLLVQRVARIRVNSSITTSDWVHYALNSSRFRAYLQPIFTGVSVPHISPEQLSNFKIPTPTHNKQIKIINNAKKQFSSHVLLTEELENSIELYRIKKTSLVQSKFVRINDQHLL